MKRIFVALFLLAFSVSIFIYGTEKLTDELDDLEKITVLLSENKVSAESLNSTWSKSKRTFALMLNEGKYKNLELHIFLSSDLKGEDLKKCCRVILYEIDVIRESQQFFIENIL